MSPVVGKFSLWEKSVVDLVSLGGKIIFSTKSRLGHLDGLKSSLKDPLRVKRHLISFGIANKLY